MDERIDARGLSCPQPVLLVRKALAEMGEQGLLTVLVDDPGSRDNVDRFATSQGCEVQVEEKAGEWEMVLTKGMVCGLPQARPEAEAKEPVGRRPVVLISTDRVGRGDEELGRVLAAAYLATFREVEPLPTHVIFINGGVRLTTEGSEQIEDIRDLEERGVEILSCGTCLDMFGLMDKLRVGRSTNTFESASILMQASRVVTFA